MVPGKSCFLQQEMTGAGQAHVVNLTVLQPGKVSCDFNSVISAPCVLCHAGNGRNLEGTLWISSAPRELLGALLQAEALPGHWVLLQCRFYRKFRGAKAQGDFWLRIFVQGEAGHSTPAAGGSEFDHSRFGKGDGRESCVTH